MTGWAQQKLAGWHARAHAPADGFSTDAAVLGVWEPLRTYAVLEHAFWTEGRLPAVPPVLQEAAPAAQPSQPSEPQPVATPPTSTAAGADAPAPRGRRSRVQNLVAQFEEGQQGEARSSSAPPPGAPSRRRPAEHMGSFLADKGAAGPALAVLGVCAAAVDALAPLFKVWILGGGPGTSVLQLLRKKSCPLSSGCDEWGQHDKRGLLHLRLNPVL